MQAIKSLSSVTVLLIVTACALTIHQWNEESSFNPYGDFTFYWATNKYIQQPSCADIYSSKGEQAINELRCKAVPQGRFFYTVRNTPLMTSLLSAVTPGNLELGARKFHLISLASFVIASVILLWLTGYGLDSGAALYLYLLLLFAPLSMDSECASTNRIQLVLIAAAFACLRPMVLIGHFGAGLFLFLGVMLKPNTIFVPMFLLISLAARRNWRALGAEAAGCLTGAVLGFAVGSLFLGSTRCWSEWLVHIMQLHADDSPLNWLNLSMPILVETITGVDLTKTLFFLGFALTSGRIISFSRGLSAADAGSGKSVPESFLVDFQAASAGGIAFLLFAHLCWSHYYTFAIPMICLLMSPRWSQAQSGMYTILALIAVNAIGLDRELGLYDYPMLAGWLTWLGALWLFLLGTTRSFPVSGPLEPTGRHSDSRA